MDLRDVILHLCVIRVKRLLLSKFIILGIGYPDIQPGHRDQLQVFYVLNLYIRVGRRLIEGTFPLSSFYISFPIKKVNLCPAITLNNGIALRILTSGDLQLNYHQIVGIGRDVENVVAHSDDLPICLGAFDFAVLGLVEFGWVDGLSRAIDSKDLLCELGSLREAQAVVPVDCETFCGVIYPILYLLVIQIRPQPCPNNILPLLINPPFIIKLAVLSSSLQLVLSPYLLQSLLLNDLSNFLSGS